LRM
jgi:hypothetical protein